MQVHDRFFLQQLPNDRADEPGGADDAGPDDEVGAEPIVALTFVEDDLKKSEADAKEGDADVIDPETQFLHIGRILDQHCRHQDGDDADRNVDKENPAPCETVGNPAAKCGTDRGRHDDTHAVDGHGHALFFAREAIDENSLGNWLKATSSRALDDAEEDEHGQTWREAAQKRADREDRNASHVELFAAEDI